MTSRPSHEQPWSAKHGNFRRIRYPEASPNTLLHIAPNFRGIQSWQQCTIQPEEEPRMHIITAISARQGFAETCIRARHSAAAQRLPQLHGDPFDCLLMMQAEVDRMLFLSADSQIMQYQKDYFVDVRARPVFSRHDARCRPDHACSPRTETCTCQTQAKPHRPPRLSRRASVASFSACFKHRACCRQ